MVCVVVCGWRNCNSRLTFRSIPLLFSLYWKSQNKAIKINWRATRRNFNMLAGAWPQPTAIDEASHKTFILPKAAEKRSTSVLRELEEASAACSRQLDSGACTTGPKTKSKRTKYFVFELAGPCNQHKMCAMYNWKRLVILPFTINKLLDWYWSNYFNC